MKKLILFCLLACSPLLAQTHKFCSTDANCTWTGNQTFSGSLAATGALSAGAGTLASLNNIVFADQKCSASGVYDNTCISNAVNALGSSGGKIIIGNHTYNFGANTVTLAPGNSNITFEGVCIGNLTSNCPRIEGTASPLISIAGSDSSTRTVNLLFSGIVFNPSSFSSTQICVQADHVTNIYYRDIQFEACGQAEDINDAFRVSHYNVLYDNCGSGDTRATACVGAENRSHTSVRTEELHWIDSVWQGATHEGIALYCGPFTQECRVTNSKFDFGSTTPTHRIVVFDNSWVGGMVNDSIAAATITTASSVVDITGTDATSRSLEISITGNPVISTNGTIPAILFDWAKWATATGNVLGGSGTATGLITLTTNSVDNAATGNTGVNSGDVISSDSGTNNSLLNHQTGGAWKVSNITSPLVINGGLLTVQGQTGNVTASFQNLADAAMNVNIKAGSTSGQDINLNFQDSSGATQSQISCASVAHGGRCTLQGNSVTGFQWDRSGIAYFPKQITSSGGTAPTLSGTGACATTSTQVGGAWSGSFVCTGTTGASTVTITPGTTAAHGWSCGGSDQTAGTALAQSANTTTTCTLKAASVTANDVLVFSALAY